MVFSGSIFSVFIQQPKKPTTNISWSKFLLCSQLLSPLGNCRGTYAQCTNQDDRQGKNRHLLSRCFTSQLVGLSFVSLVRLSRLPRSLRAHHGVFSLATAAHTFLALSQQQLTCFLSANYPFPRSLRSTSWNVG